MHRDIESEYGSEYEDEQSHTSYESARLVPNIPIAPQITRPQPCKDVVAEQEPVHPTAAPRAIPAPSPRENERVPIASPTRHPSAYGGASPRITPFLQPQQRVVRPTEEPKASRFPPCTAYGVRSRIKPSSQPADIPWYQPGNTIRFKNGFTGIVGASTLFFVTYRFINTMMPYSSHVSTANLQNGRVAGFGSGRMF